MVEVNFYRVESCRRNTVGAGDQRRKCCGQLTHQPDRKKQVFGNRFEHEGQSDTRDNVWRHERLNGQRAVSTACHCHHRQDNGGDGGNEEFQQVCRVQARRREKHGYTCSQAQPYKRGLWLAWYTPRLLTLLSSYWVIKKVEFMFCFFKSEILCLQVWYFDFVVASDPCLNFKYAKLIFLSLYILQTVSPSFAAILGLFCTKAHLPWESRR